MTNKLSLRELFQKDITRIRVQDVRAFGRACRTPDRFWNSAMDDARMFSTLKSVQQYECSAGDVIFTAIQSSEKTVNIDDMIRSSKLAYRLLWLSDDDLPVLAGYLLVGETGHVCFVWTEARIAESSLPDESKYVIVFEKRDGAILSFLAKRGSSIQRSSEFDKARNEGLLLDLEQELFAGSNMTWSAFASEGNGQGSGTAGGGASP